MNDRERQIALAKVGLRALVDEATGYQDVRSSEDLLTYAEQLGIGDVTDIITERIRLAMEARSQ